MRKFSHFVMLAVLLGLATVTYSGLSILSSGSATAAEINLRPGDILALQLPGETAFDDLFTVDRAGNINLPEVGPLSVKGKPLSEAGDEIRKALGTIYRDVERLTVSLKDRRLSVTVLGFVKKPGAIDLPAEASIQTALAEAGGLSQGAQMDRLQVRRNGRVIPFDYKKYLDTGDDTLLPGLRPLDTIFVPASPLIGNVQVEFDARTLTASGDAGDGNSSIKVFGEVHRPGLFGYKKGNDIVDMLMRAGGVTRYAGVEQIRVVNKGAPYPFNLREYLDTGDVSLLPELNPGDTIFVPQRSEQVEKGARTVYVMGEVFKPGAYETKDGATFFDILANAGGPTRFAETRQIRILRLDGKVEPFDLQKYTEGVAKVELPDISPGDAILVPEKTDINEKSWLKVAPSRAVRIIGSVVRPGRYEWSDEMSLIDLIAHAGGPQASADTANLQILLEAPDGQIKAAKFDLENFLKLGGSAANLPRITAGATVVIPELPKDPSDNRSQWVKLTKERSIYIFGQVGAPGRYAFNDKLTFLDILSAANGPLQTADLRNIRVSHRGEQGARISKFNLSLYFETGDESILPVVRPEDVIYVPQLNPQFLDKKKEVTVRILGAVNRPGRYTFNDTMTILDLLAEAGGPTQNAYQQRIVVVNRSETEPRASSFDLVDFARQGDFDKLPVIRVGDTVYVPNKADSPMVAFRETLRDIISIITIGSLAFGG